jgi:hypothetical protein
MELQVLKDEINLLNDLSKDMSFDNVVLEDAKDLIKIKNQKIIDLGGEPVLFTVEQSVGISNEDAIRIIIKKMGVFKRFISTNEVALKKYNLLNKMLKGKTGVTYEDYLAKGEKFLYGGELSGDYRLVFNNLIKTNEFVLFKETKHDAILKYITPENSYVFQVLTPNANVIFALAYFVYDVLKLDFYKDEYLNKSLNLSYSFTKTYSVDSFENQYIELKKILNELDKKLENQD